MSFQDLMESIKRWMFRILFTAGIFYGGYLMFVAWIYPDWATPIALRNFLLIVVALFAIAFVVCLVWFILWFLLWAFVPNIPFAFNVNENGNSRPGIFLGFLISVLMILAGALVYCFITGVTTDFSFIGEFFGELIDSFSEIGNS